jgi:hypothetical protein
LHLFLAVVTGAGIGLAPASAQDAADPALPPAAALIEEVRARLPREPLEISGELSIRRQKGIVIGRVNMDISMDLGGRPASVRYSIRDAFGKDMEQMTITRHDDGAVRMDYEKGDPLEPAALPAMYEPIQGSDVSWADLAVVFLTWPGGQTVGRDQVKGQPCFVVEVVAPQGTGRDASERPYARVRLWIHEQMRMLLQVEGYDAGGGLVRRLQIRGVRRVGQQRWMVKEMEVESFPSAHRTRFCVRDAGGTPGYDGGSGG